MQPSFDENLVVFFDNEFRALRDANVNFLTHALHYGTGVFEGIRGYWNEEDKDLYLFRAREHYERWRGNARLLKMDIPLSPGELCEVTSELVRRNQLRTDVYVRPLAWKSRRGIGVHFGPECAIAIAVLPFGAYIDSAKGLRVAVSSWRRVDDNAIPARGKICGAYVNSGLAGDEARSNGFDEAIFLTERGHVCEGAASNIFLVRHGKLITPPVYDNILEGITRSTVMDLAADMWVETVERPVDRSELYVAEEVFFAGTAFEIAPVIEVDRHPVGNGQIGRLTRRLQEAYTEVARGRTARGGHWRTPAYRAAQARATAQAVR
jgi:branched-chain amino acid aminotransferase